MIHHKDEIKTRNVFENLALRERGAHTSEHMRTRPLKDGPVHPSTIARRKKKALSCSQVI